MHGSQFLKLRNVIRRCSELQNNASAHCRQANCIYAYVDDFLSNLKFGEFQELQKWFRNATVQENLQYCMWL